MDENQKITQDTVEWLILSMQIVPFYYGVIPAKELYKIFQSGRDGFPGRENVFGVKDISEKDYMELLHSILDIANLPEFVGTPGVVAAGIVCKFDGDDVVQINAPEMVKAIRAEKKNAKIALKEYKILSFDEVMQVLEKGYIATPETDAFEKYLQTKRGKSQKEAVEIVGRLSFGYRTGEMNVQDSLKDLSNIFGLNQKENAITSDELKEMLTLILNLHSNTGIMSRNGWSPNELYEKVYGQKAPVITPNVVYGQGNGFMSLFNNIRPGSKIVPDSSKMSERLKQHEAELKEKGFEVDYDENASTHYNISLTQEGTVKRTKPKKIYPNDPCPCGSGRRYKICHGREK